VVGGLMISPARMAGNPARLVHFDLHARRFIRALEDWKDFELIRYNVRSMTILPSSARELLATMRWLCFAGGL